MTTDKTLSRLAFDFFVMFARTEHALMKAGYLEKPTGDARADWNRLSTALDNLIGSSKDIELIEAVDYVLKFPPKKLTAANGKLQWTESNPPYRSTAQNLIVYVRRIRNNLFHGGKFNGEWVDPQRTETLMRHGL